MIAGNFKQIPCITWINTSRSHQHMLQLQELDTGISLVIQKKNINPLSDSTNTNYFLWNRQQQTGLPWDFVDVLQVMECSIFR